MSRTNLAARQTIPVRSSAAGANTVSRLRERVLFRDWALHLGISKEGRHIYGFESGFPLAVLGYRLAYRDLLPNYHNYLEVGYVCRGAGLLCISDKEYALNANDLIVIGSDEVHGVQATGKAPFCLLSVFFMPNVVFPAADDDASFDLTQPFFAGSRHVLRPGEFDHAAVFRTMFRMYRMATDRPRYYRLLLKQSLFELLLKILRHYDRNGLLGAQPGGNAMDRRSRIHRLNSVFALVETHHGERISLDQVADMCHMSRNYFCRFFKSVTGTSFVEYLNRFRVNRAKLLMLEGDLTTTQVAYQVGFGNLGYFYRVFRRYADLPPREFVSKYKAR